MHPVRETVELAVAQVVEEDFPMGRHEYAWHCLKAMAQPNTVWQSMDSQSRLCLVLYFQLWRMCLSLLFELFSPKVPLQKSQKEKSLILFKKIFKYYKCMPYFVLIIFPHPLCYSLFISKIVYIPLPNLEL